MSTVLRVPTARFKYNMRPLVDQARAGAVVIVTKDGKDDFQVLPCQPSGPPPVSDTPLDPAAYRGVDVDVPGFQSWEDDESAA
jgi:antitoxin (DNA-binding transcriptional repressor) of toxin-antitoxin stability system